VRTVPDLVESCEALARVMQPLADAEGRAYLVVRPHRAETVDGYAPVLPWAVALEDATPSELRHAAGRVVPAAEAVYMPATRPVTPAARTPDPARPRSRRVEPQTGRGG
jgi:hypothetical protein